jgi:hypothetical protein
LQVLGLDDMTAIERLQALLSERMQGESYKFTTDDVTFIDNKQQADSLNT